MFFLISRILSKFRYLNYSPVIILAFVGLKMIFSHTVEIPEWLSLAVIALALAGGIIASITLPENKDEGENQPVD